MLGLVIYLPVDNIILIKFLQMWEEIYFCLVHLPVPLVVYCLQPAACERLLLAFRLLVFLNTIDGSLAHHIIHFLSLSESLLADLPLNLSLDSATLPQADFLLAQKIETMPDACPLP